ncbi:uncharacterized protein TrAtP1_009956 [Trichoderma atroviride]|uniref:uncharacterized protein n=1 Tax=Hypocrea atroviridis TaxID=63577 RepID=UPI003328FB0F|nr:hypothetical protein TrAtP1_009956 [Trichoderma atroviride]
MAQVNISQEAKSKHGNVLQNRVFGMDHIHLLSAVKPWWVPVVDRPLGRSLEPVAGGFRIQFILRAGPSIA